MASFTPQAAARGVQRLLLVVGLATLGGVLVAGLLLPVVGAAGLAVRGSAETFKDLPVELTTAPLAQRSVVLDDEGKILATFFDEFRIYRKLDQIPDVMKQALIATEDARFYEHGPIDLYGTSRALVRNVQSGEGALSGQGASTLTQQYVKLLQVDQAKTPEDIRRATAPTPARKLRELRLAVAVEERYTKDQILERYLNIAYFGNGAYGVEAAARKYFSVSVGKLTLPQAAMIAGLVQSPSRYDPTRNPELALSRRNDVLARMETVGEITPADLARTRKLPLGLKPSSPANGCITSYAPFFCDYIVNEVRATPSLGATPDARLDTLKRGGLVIRTTLDRETQEAAQEAVLSEVDPTDTVASAIAMIEPGTGEITAMAQSRGYGDGRGKTYINYAVDKDRGSSIGFQPGSTMKVFVLAAAIAQGIPLDYSINSPEQIDVGDRRFRTCDGSVRSPGYAPKNSTSSGMKDLRSGTEESVNTFFIQLQLTTGLCQPVRIAERLGLTQAGGEPLKQVPSFTLGSNEVSPLSMAEAYATFASGGIHCNPVAITAIDSLDGKTYAQNSADCKRALPANVANTVASVLRGVIDGPNPARTGQNQDIGRPAAGKTGTTTDTKAVWFVGFTPQLAAAVAVADPRGPQTGPLYGRRIGGQVRGFDEVSGGRLPGPMWAQAMRAALRGQPALSFDSARPYGSDRSRREQQEQSGPVPTVRGVPVLEALQQLSGAGYSWSIAGRVNSAAPSGTVAYTSPRGGSNPDPGTTVRVWISR